MPWQVFSASTIGANHVHAGKGNQDAVRTVPEDGMAETVILAVADGHGSDRYVRSAIGSRIATDVTVRLAAGFAAATRAESRLAVKSLAEDAMPRDLARQWRERVREHLREHPLDGVATDDPEGESAAIATYGTTVLGTVITSDLLVCWQLGDGDILLIDEAGMVTAPLETPSLGVETDSLLEREAWRNFRTHWSPLAADTALVILSTDGLANSFKSRADFREFGSDVLRELRSHGIQATRERLPGWLGQATDFSGDDVTVAGAWKPATTPEGVP